MAVTLTLTLPVAVPSEGDAQTEIAVELGASQVGPPAGVEAADARFGMAGLRASHEWMGGSSLSADLLFGRAFGEAAGGDFVSATAGADFASALTASWSAAMEVEVLGFEIRAPFPYRALAAEGGPRLRYGGPAVSLEVAGVAGLGRSRFELRRRDAEAVRVLHDELWRLGGRVEVLLGSRPAWVGLAGGTHRTSAGTYRTGGARLVLGGAWGAAEARFDVWDAPFGVETTGGLALVLPLGGDWSLRGFLGKAEPDPLTLAEPGSGSGGLLLGRTLYRREPAARAASLHEVLSATPSGARVRVVLDGVEGARRVELLGDFTLWEAVPMRRNGESWAVELEVPAGTHHYGFLVDDEWYLPDDAPDVVPDGWGRSSATLVIEGAGR